MNRDLLKLPDPLEAIAPNDRNNFEVETNPETEFHIRMTSQNYLSFAQNKMFSCQRTMYFLLACIKKIDVFDKVLSHMAPLRL